MESIIYAIGFSVAAMILALPFIKKYERRARTAPEPDEKEEGGGMVLETVRGAFKSLTRQRAAAFGPWLSCIIERGGAPASVAVTALKRTRYELTGSRFDLSGLDRAIEALESETGAGE